MEFKTREAGFRLADGNLTCEMKIHFYGGGGPAVVEPVLRSWAADADLRLTRDALCFEFDGAEIIDRSPAPPGVIRGRLHALTGNFVVTATGTVYPT